MTVTSQEIQQISVELNNSHFERGDAIQACILAILSGEHVFMLGPPGTAKSALARDLASRLTGARYFETLLSRTRPAEAVLGPLDLPKLRDTGAFVRKIDGFLPTADIAFLDECGNMSPTLGHDLHSIMNERVYHEVHEDGKSVHPVPLMSALTAGNVIPTEESDDAKALWDRIVLRAEVNYIEQDGAFTKLFDTVQPTTRTTVSWEDLKHAIVEDIPFIPIPIRVIELMIEVKEKLANMPDLRSGDGVILSDRRWKACAKVMRANAWLNGRDQVAESDLMALRFVLWNEQHEIKPVERVLIAFADKVSDQVRTLREQIQDMTQGIMLRKGQSREQRADHAAYTVRQSKGIKQELIRIGAENPGHEEVRVTLEQFRKMWNLTYEVLFEVPPKSFDDWMKAKDEK
jgi:MoxR-like ATPase